MSTTAALIPMIIFLLAFCGAVYVASTNLGKGILWASLALVALAWVFWFLPNAADFLVGLTIVTLLVVGIIGVALWFQNRRDEIESHRAEEAAREIEYDFSHPNVEE